MNNAQKREGEEQRLSKLGWKGRNRLHIKYKGSEFDRETYCAKIFQVENQQSCISECLILHDGKRKSTGKK
jgi:hypothetical protein